MNISPQWMPVFVVLNAESTVSASVSDSKTHTSIDEVLEGEDFWQRVGTAIPREDGGFNINLYAIPMNGRLVVRPPQPNEYQDPVRKA